MMKKGNIITLDGTKKYFVVSTIEYSNKQYVYLINVNEYADYKIAFVKKENQVTKVVIVKDKVLLEKLMLLFSKDLINTMKQYEDLRQSNQ